MKKQITIGLLVLVLSCAKKTENKSEQLQTLPDRTATVVNKPEVAATKNEVMLEKDILFNGKLRRYFSVQDFEKVFAAADSTKLISEIEPCTAIFENPDGSKDSDDLYLYKDGSRFEKNKNNIAVDRFRFTKNNYLLFKNIKIDAATTLSDLKSVFPNALKNLETIDVYGEGDLQAIILLEDAEAISDGYIQLFFKNNHAYFIQWWFPC